MKSKLFVSAYLFILLTTTASPASASTVLVLDTAAKSSAYLPQQIVEAKDLLAHLEDGERVAVVPAAPTRTVFDTGLGPEERSALGSALATVYAGKGGSDLGAALAVAASLAGRWPGPKRVSIFTPVISQPPERSALYGKTLEELVADSGLVPDDTALMVRVYGTAPLASTRANVRLLRETPQRHSEPAFARASPTPAEPTTAES